MKLVIEEILLDAWNAGQILVFIVFCVIETITVIVSVEALLISILIRNFHGRKFIIAWITIGQILMILLFVFWRQSIRIL